ncbi:MAG: CHAT domain-containing protein [Mariniphaga sp.]|nr:CHAT domain-containing protein [Mariniphaga sp.]
MKVLSLLYFLFLSTISLASNAQASATDTVVSVYAKYGNQMKSGHLMEAATSLSGLLKPNFQLTGKQKLVIYNNLGIIHKKLGQFDIALGYYDAAESIYLTNNFTDNSFLMSIYGNKANIYVIKGEFNKALEYVEKAIRSVQEGTETGVLKQQTTSSLYLNSGIVYYQLNDFTQAIIAFKKSLSLKEKYTLPGKDIVYLQFAKTYAKNGNSQLADKYFKLSIKQSESERSNVSINLASTCLEYGDFLMLINENSKALIIIQKALKITVQNFGEKNQLTANCYQIMGDYYRRVKDYQEALTYYQKALVSGSKTFNASNIQVNPTMNDITLNLWQLRLLQSKAEALLSLASEEKVKREKINYLSLSLNTINLAIEMTNSIRFDYQNVETRLVFNEKQKNVFVAALETALQLYDLSGERSYLHLAYQTAQQCKANELKYEISKNKSYTDNEIPDSLRNKENKLQQDIAAYNNLIQNELALIKPDTAKIAFWKDQQFALSRDLEKTIEQTEKKYPRFIDKIKKGNIIRIAEIQANLKPDDSLIEYLFSEKDEKGSRKLYEFVITPTDLICHTEIIDSTLSANFSLMKDRLLNQYTPGKGLANYNQLNQLLFDAYRILIQPLEKHFAGKQLIIIPDDDISYLPFDAFLTSWTKKRQINYAELSYLISTYTISYAYSTNTLWNNQLKAQNRPRVIGLAPDYSNTALADGKRYSALKTNNREVESILTNFDGTVLKGGQATIANFRSNLNGGVILHLAMHAELDTLHSGSSSLIFAPDVKNAGNYRLYNYEIGQMNIISPMVVLSACNTGGGKLYSGEGLMSLARSFVLAGVPAVIETLWPVEDVAGSKIMGSFYKYLAQGMPKNIALRQAKLDYISTTSPSFVNPQFWAAYTLVGDVSALKRIWWKDPLIFISLFSLFLIIVAILIYRFKFLRIN